MKNTKASTMAALITGLLACGGFCAQANAQVSFVGSAGALGANDYVDWGLFGTDFTVVSSGSTILSAGGLTMMVSTSNGTDMERRNQGTGWSGNFANGDHLLWNQGNEGDINIDFSTGVYGLGGGAQVQADHFGAFTGTISAYDEALTPLGTFEFVGNSTSAGDNSAVFAGIFDSSGSIHRIVFHVYDSAGANDFAINSLQLKTTGTETVPDGAATLALLGLALAGLALVRRKLGST